MALLFCFCHAMESLLLSGLIVYSCHIVIHCSYEVRNAAASAEDENPNFTIFISLFIWLQLYYRARKEESVSTDPTFSVSVIFGKRDEVGCSYQIISRV